MALKDLIGELPERTTEAEKDEIDDEVVEELLFKHPDVPASKMIRAVQTRVQIVETARWVLAMDDRYITERRRLVAQKKVATHHERTNTGGGDEEDDGMTLQAVQKKVRRVFDGRYGRKTAQEHLDEILEDIENDYQTRMETR